MIQINPQDKVFRMKPFQARFVRSTKRYPAMVSAWGTGKTLCLIGRGMMLSESFKDNLGVIFRKEYTDLRDSTIKDFENYTSLKVNSAREVKVGSSTIMFRHLEEMNNIQNMNLGWFGIEQGDELDSDEYFFKLMGRLRRQGCKHSGFVIANTNGHNWMHKLWKVGKLEDSELIEATTFDNSDNLPQAFLDSLKQIKAQKPEIYDRFVMNSWDVGEDAFIVIPFQLVSQCIGITPIREQFTRKVTVCDVAGEGESSDETVIYDLENSKIVNEEIYRHRSLMDTVGRCQAHAQKHGSTVICVDKVGEGSGVYSRLQEVYQANEAMTVYGFDGRLKAPEGLDDDTFANYKTYAWFKAKKAFEEMRASLPDDPELHRQLAGIPYKYTSAGSGAGKYILEDKKKIKEKLGCSPDRADAYIMGLDALQYAKTRLNRESDNNGWSGNSYVPVRQVA